MTTDDTRWLDESELDAWVPLVALLLTLPGTLDAQLQRDAGLTFYEYTVLAGLSSAGPEGLRMSELAVVTNGSLSRLSQVVTRMEQRDWLARKPDATDGRVTRVVLRPAGRRAIGNAAPGHVEHVRRLVFDNLTSTQVRELRRIATKVASALPVANSVLMARRRAADAE